MADVFEGFGGVLAAYVEEDFFAASVCRMQTISDHLLGNVFIVCNIPMENVFHILEMQRHWMGESGPGGLLVVTYGCSSTKVDAL
jgi:hypothetical protein